MMMIIIIIIFIIYNAPYTIIIKALRRNTYITKKKHNYIHTTNCIKY